MTSYSEIIDLLIKYRILGVSALVSVILFAVFQFGVSSVEKSEMCSEELNELRSLTVALQQNREALAECEAKGAGRAVLLCRDDCDERIKIALSEAQAWACED